MLPDQLGHGRSRTWQRGCALLFWTAGERLLVFLVLNVLAAGIWDIASGRNNRITLLGLRHFIGWHQLTSVLLLRYLGWGLQGFSGGG